MKCQCCPHIETSQLICCANQLTGFYVMVTLASNGLNLLSNGNGNECYLIWFKNACILLLPWANDSKVKVLQIQSMKQTQVSIELEQLQHKNTALKRSSAIGVAKIKEGSIKLPLWYKWWLTQDLFRTLLNTCNGVFLQKSWKSLHHRFLTVS